MLRALAVDQQRLCIEHSEREGFPITSLREMNILSAIDHPYIVGVKEIVVGTDLNSIFMVMEISNHDLCGTALTVLQHHIAGLPL